MSATQHAPQQPAQAPKPKAVELTDIVAFLRHHFPGAVMLPGEPAAEPAKAAEPTPPTGLHA